MGIQDKKDWSRTGLPEWYQEFINSLPKHLHQAFAGLGMGKMVEVLPPFIEAPCEKIIKNADSYIVLGRDRPEGALPASMGYGPKASTGAHSIDLVVGRNAAVEFGIQDVEDPITGEQKPIHPNFNTDAARVYISQKADIDAYFGIHEIDVGKMPPAEGKSAVGIKADNVRLIARETIKLVSAFPDTYNSQGTKNADCKGGIYLVHGTSGKAQEELFSMVKGENLVEALYGDGGVLDMIGAIADSLSATQTTLTKFFGMYAGHGHITAAPGSPVSPLDAPIAPALCLPEIAKEIVGIAQGHSQNDAGHRVNYGRNFGGKFLLSQWHKLN